MISPLPCPTKLPTPCRPTLARLRMRPSLPLADRQVGGRNHHDASLVALRLQLLLPGLDLLGDLPADIAARRWSGRSSGRGWTAPAGEGVGFAVQLDDPRGRADAAFRPWQMVPLPAPTAPSGKSSPALWMACIRCSSLTARSQMSLRRLSLHSPTHRVDAPHRNPVLPAAAHHILDQSILHQTHVEGVGQGDGVSSVPSS